MIRPQQLVILSEAESKDLWLLLHFEAVANTDYFLFGSDLAGSRDCVSPASDSTGPPIGCRFNAAGGKRTLVKKKSQEAAKFFLSYPPSRVREGSS